MKDEMATQDPRSAQSAPAIQAGSQVQLVQNRQLRLLLQVAGSIALVLGVLGIFLPVLPTTPFILLAAACFARSSARFYYWLCNHRFFGPLVRDWREHRSISLRAKVVAISSIVLTLGSSIVFFIPWFWAKLVATLIGVSVIFYLIRFPTRGEASSSTQTGSVQTQD